MKYGADYEIDGMEEEGRETKVDGGLGEGNIICDLQSEMNVTGCGFFVVIKPTRLNF